MFSQQYRLFWSSNVVNLVSRKDKGINRSYLGHILAEKMRIAHALVRIKHMYNSFFKGCSNLYFVRKSK